MKKAIIALLFIVFSNSYAGAGCNILRVSVKNDSPSYCYLVDRKVKSGSIYKRFLYKIAPGTKAVQFEILDAYKKPARILLTYECGDNRSISLLSTNGVCTKYIIGKIEGSIERATNMTAVFTSNVDRGYFSSGPSSIDWIIS